MLNLLVYKFVIYARVLHRMNK